MKSIIKNNIDNATNIAKLVEMQGKLQQACLISGLSLSSNIHPTPAGLWEMTYGIGFFNEQRTVIMGQTGTTPSAKYEYDLLLVRGEYTSELFPPVFGSVDVAYWKRHLITDMDVTDPGAENTRNQPAVKSLWVGFSEKGLEQVRVPDGTKNTDFGLVGRVEYVAVPTRGVCVFVVRKDYVAPVKTEKPMAHSDLTTAGTGPMAYMAPIATLTFSMVDVKAKNNAMKQVLPRHDVPTQGHTYIVKSGDTLSKIAETAYGDWKFYDHLKEVNRDLISDADVVQEGIEIIIPKL